MFTFFPKSISFQLNYTTVKFPDVVVRMNINQVRMLLKILNRRKYLNFYADKYSKGRKDYINLMICGVALFIENRNER